MTAPAIDIRDTRSTQIARAGDHRIVRGRAVVRPAHEIDTVCLHQTACVFGPMAHPEVRYLRAADVASHAVAFRTGVGVLQTPVRWYVNGGNGWNTRALHLECEGHYCGQPDDPATAPRREDRESCWGAEPTPLDDLALLTARETLRALVKAARAEGCPVQYIVAHRQSSPSRRSDPGYELWRDVVINYAVPVLGLRTRPAVVVGQGRPIPACWGEGSAAY